MSELRVRTSVMAHQLPAPACHHALSASSSSSTSHNCPLLCKKAEPRYESVMYAEFVVSTHSSERRWPKSGEDCCDCWHRVCHSGDDVSERESKSAVTDNCKASESFGQSTKRFMSLTLQDHIHHPCHNVLIYTPNETLSPISYSILATC